MKHFLPIIILLCFGCKSKFPDVPKDIIPMNKMKLILIDMHITDAIAETKAQMGGDERILSEKYDEQLFKNYGVTHADFIKSYKFYENNPSLLNKMYYDILNELSKREEEAGKKN